MLINLAAKYTEEINVTNVIWWCQTFVLKCCRVICDTHVSVASDS